MKMKLKLNLNLLVMVLAGFSIAMSSEGRAAPLGGSEQVPSLSQADKQEIFKTLATKLKDKYVFPEIALQMQKSLATKLTKGDYAKADNVASFSQVLSKDLVELSKDKHFRVEFDPEFKEDETPNAVPSKEEFERQKAEVMHLGYGIEKVENLPGNVGYMEIRGFGPTEVVGPAYTAAMSLLAGTDALILDLRRNGGGKPSSVAYLMSHFFPLGDERHLNDIYSRPDNSTQQYWTLPSVNERYTKPVYVLTSPRTFSGGEECAYDFQTQKRATLVGETTGGGAHPVDLFSLGHGMVVAIPIGKAINPITHTDWEQVGVKPDVAVPAALAQQTAYVMILRDLLAKSKDSEERQFLQKTLALAEKGEREPPNFTAHRQ